MQIYFLQDWHWNTKWSSLCCYVNHRGSCQGLTIFFMSPKNLNAMHPHIKKPTRKNLWCTQLEVTCKVYTTSFDAHQNPTNYIHLLIIIYAVIFPSMGIHIIAINTEPLNVLLLFNLLNIDQIWLPGPDFILYFYTFTTYSTIFTLLSLVSPIVTCRCTLQKHSFI